MKYTPPMPRKVIFLDIDGVMNSIGPRVQDPRGLVDFLDPGNVAVLNTIVAATGAVIVISSMWRLHTPFPELLASFAAAGCTGQIVDITPDIDPRERHLEVAAWLAQQAEPPHRFVVIDDEFDMPNFPDKLVRTRKLFGLGARELPDVLALLAD